MNERALKFQLSRRGRINPRYVEDDLNRFTTVNCFMRVMHLRAAYDGQAGWHRRQRAGCRCT
jgi:hypothetical protein